MALALPYYPTLIENPSVSATLEKTYVKTENWLQAGMVLMNVFIELGKRLKLASLVFLILSIVNVSPAAENGRMYEISPHVGFMGASKMAGIRAGMNYGSLSFELAAAEVIGQYATLFPLTASGLLNLGASKKAVPYGLIGGGLFLTSAQNAIGSHTVSSLGMNFGAGLRYFLSPRFGLRFETKQLFTSINNGNDNRSELLIFQETTLGLLFSFG